MNIWDLLDIEPTYNITDIKKAFAVQSRQHHPEDDPEGFRNLRTAYQQALQIAKIHAQLSNASANSTISADNTSSKPTIKEPTKKRTFLNSDTVNSNTANPTTLNIPNLPDIPPLPDIPSLPSSSPAAPPPAAPPQKSTAVDKTYDFSLANRIIDTEKGPQKNGNSLPIQANPAHITDNTSKINNINSKKRNKPKKNKIYTTIAIIALLVLIRVINNNGDSSRNNPYKPIGVADTYEDNYEFYNSSNNPYHYEPEAFDNAIFDALDEYQYKSLKDQALDAWNSDEALRDNVLMHLKRGDPYWMSSASDLSIASNTYNNMLEELNTASEEDTLKHLKLYGLNSTVFIINELHPALKECIQNGQLTKLSKLGAFVGLDYSTCVSFVQDYKENPNEDELYKLFIPYNHLVPPEQWDSYLQ